MFKADSFLLVGYSEAPLLGHSNSNTSSLATSDLPPPFIPVVLTAEGLLALANNALGGDTS